ncbi:hypothetical protein VTN77DRAFT_9794 [Rasamsonia byssochlamydoides]|uniref:uncharacterized protein n=1 Tax=Rasamsonia byssochlamydoides TaxID=89139 RepID=UPI0037424B2A
MIQKGEHYRREEAEDGGHNAWTRGWVKRTIASATFIAFWARSRLENRARAKTPPSRAAIRSCLTLEGKLRSEIAQQVT